MSSVDLVAHARRYYDANTARFLRYGQGGSLGTVRRAVWAPAVRSEREAFEYADQFILQRLSALQSGSTLHVLDLGCGVGASLVYLATQLPLRGTGITVSGVQAELGQARVAALGLSSRVRIMEASYLDLPPQVGEADAAFSIEAFVHCPDPERYFAQASAHVRRGGLVLVLDDFLSDRQSAFSPREQRTLDEFRQGWVTAPLLKPSAVATLAGRHGLTWRESVDLTPHLELGRLRDRAIAALVSVARHLPLRRREYMKSLLGGSALQLGLTQGLLEYRFLVFERI